MREWSARVTAGALPQAATKTVAPTIEAICVHIFIVWIPHTRKIWEGSSDSYKVRIRRLQRSCQRRMAYLRRAKWPVLQAFVHVCTRGVQSNGVTRLRSRGMRACAWACDGVPRRMRRQGGRLHARGADCRRGAPCSRKVSNRPDKVGGLRRCRDGAAAVARFHYRDFHRIGHAEAGKRAWRGAAFALVTGDGFSAASGLLESDLHMARLKRAKGVERSVRAADAPGPAAIMDAGPG